MWNGFPHVLRGDQFDRKVLDELCELTTVIRAIDKTEEGSRYLVNLLKTKRAMVFFDQPSSRTYESLVNACYILGIRVTDLRDITTSSVVKGESDMDSIRTHSSYVHVIMMRTKDETLADRSAAMMDKIGVPHPRRHVPIINGGSGTKEHPTQALLDIYTLHRSFKGVIEGKVVGMMGDLKRGRTVRSLSKLLVHYPGVKIHFIAPPAFQMEEDIKQYLREHNVEFFQHTEGFRSVLPELDALYVTRIQDEHDRGGESAMIDMSQFKFQPEDLDDLGDNGIIMHPLPRRDEIHPDVDDDPRAKYWRQERNGMWMRTALLVKIFGIEDKILDYRPSFFRRFIYRLIDC